MASTDDLAFFGAGVVELRAANVCERGFGRAYLFTNEVSRFVNFITLQKRPIPATIKKTSFWRSTLNREAK